MTCVNEQMSELTFLTLTLTYLTPRPKIQPQSLRTNDHMTIVVTRMTLTSRLVVQVEQSVCFVFLSVWHGNNVLTKQSLT